MIRMEPALQLSPLVRAKIKHAKIARLATVDAFNRPHVVPICFCFDGSAFFTAFDKKPKRVRPEELARARNVRANPCVALVIDHYDENWSRLWYVMVRGTAEFVPKSSTGERRQVIQQLKAKYPQYKGGILPEDAPILRITPKLVACWGDV